MNNLIIKNKHLKYLVFILPSLIGFYIFSIHPNLWVYSLSFNKWNGVSKKIWVGWQNYEIIFKDPKFMQSVKNTVLYIVLLLVGQTIIAIGLSVILSKNNMQNKFFRTFFFLPIVLSSVTVGLTWQYMYDGNIGMINQIFVSLGNVSMKGFNWIGEDATRSIICIVFIHIWHNLGYPLTILTASISGIPTMLYEAAAVEGANPFQVFWKITLPLIMPSVFTLLLLTTITGAQAFDYVYIMSGSMVSSRFDTFAVSLYKDLANGSNLGIPAAKGIMLGIILMIVIIFQNRLSKTGFQSKSSRGKKYE